MIAKTLVGALLCALVLAVFASQPRAVAAASLAFKLHCDKTTEMGEDEVYFVVSSKKSDGTVTSERLPGASAHWDMNDNGKKPDLDLPSFIDFDLKKGESMVVLVNVMEEDGGGTRQWLDFGNEIFKNVPPNKITTPIQSVLSVLSKVFPNIQDTDDFIGSFRVNLSNDSDSPGTIKADWSAVERANYLGHSSGPRSHGFRFNGDGTNYYGWGEMFRGDD